MGKVAVIFALFFMLVFLAGCIDQVSGNEEASGEVTGYEESPGPGPAQTQGEETVEGGGEAEPQHPAPESVPEVVIDESALEFGSLNFSECVEGQNVTDYFQFESITSIPRQLLPDLGVNIHRQLVFPEEDVKVAERTIGYYADEWESKFRNVVKPLVEEYTSSIAYLERAGNLAEEYESLGYARKVIGGVEVFYKKVSSSVNPEDTVFEWVVLLPSTLKKIVVGFGPDFSEEQSEKVLHQFMRGFCPSD